METWDALRARRNVRTYRPDPVPAADLERLAEAAWRAPSGGNRQHRDFIVVTDREQLTELATVWQGGSHTVAYLIGAGYPADRPLSPIRKPDRRPFDQVVHYGRFTGTPGV